jgi:hypothetical protein
VTAAASVVTPTVVPTGVLIALMDQNPAIATAATALASSMRGAKSSFIIPLTLPFSPHICSSRDMRDLRVFSAATPYNNGGLPIPVLSHIISLGKDPGILTSAEALSGGHPFATTNIRIAAIFAKQRWYAVDAV